MASVLLIPGIISMLIGVETMQASPNTSFSLWLICSFLIGLTACSRPDPVGSAIKQLHDPQPLVRREAADKLSLSHDPRAVEPLIAALKDQDAEVRKAAAKALGSLRDARAAEPLIACLSTDDDELRKIAVTALRNLNDPQVGARLLLQLQKIKDADATKAALIEALGELRYAQAIETLTSLLGSQSDEISGKAAEALTQIGAPAVPPLIAGLKDPNSQVRSLAAETLGKIGDSRATEPLIALMKHPSPEAAATEMPEATTTEPVEKSDETPSPSEKDSQVRQKVAEALGKLGPAAVEPLIACLNESDPAVRGLAATALGQIKDARAVKPLIAVLTGLAEKNEENSDDSSAHDSVIDALANLGDPATAALVPYLQDKNPRVRQDAAEALSRLHYEPADTDGKIAFFILRRSWDELIKIGAPAVGPLLASLNDDDSETRKGAADALGQIGDKRAVESLIKCLGDQSMEVQSNAARALGLLGDKRAVEPLIHILGYETNEVKKAAAEALSLLGDSRAIAPLVTGLTEGDAELRLTCAQALEKLHYQPEKAEDNVAYLIALQSWDKVAKLGAPAYEPLVACLSEQSSDVREGAIGALGNLGDKRAIKPLSDALPDWNLNATLVAALEQLGWKPTSDAEQVYAWIAHKDSEQLKKNWEKTRQVLLADVDSIEHRNIENAVYTFMAIGNEKIIDDLVQTLEDHGTQSIAETYLNCGNDRLEQAARNWASAHGYQIIPIPGSSSQHWGSW